jgi:hypothetical protein
MSFISGIDWFIGMGALKSAPFLFLYNTQKVIDGQK